jgi:hypothetical protein
VLSTKRRKERGGGQKRDRSGQRRSRIDQVNTGFINVRGFAISSEAQSRSRSVDGLPFFGSHLLLRFSNPLASPCVSTMPHIPLLGSLLVFRLQT